MPYTLVEDAQIEDVVKDVPDAFARFPRLRAVYVNFKYTPAEGELFPLFAEFPEAAARHLRENHSGEKWCIARCDGMTAILAGHEMYVFRAGHAPAGI